MKDSRIREFEKILEGIRVPANMGMEQQAQLMKPISDIVEEMLPSRLYRFRQCSERNFDAVYKDQIWVSRGSDVNDDYDTCLYYDNKKINEWLKSLHDEKFYLKILNLKSTQSIPKLIRDFFPSSRIREKVDNNSTIVAA